MPSLTRIPPEVGRQIGHYVYLYSHPRSGVPIYVGKGKGSRVLAHVKAAGPSRKARVLRDLRRKGLRPKIEILAHGIEESETALRIEAAVIDALGLEKLTNGVRGWRSIELGRMPVRDIVAYYNPRPVRIVDPVLLIRVNQLYRHGMSDLELYEATRGIWRLNPERAAGAHYALAVFEGVVREVYRIHRWDRAGSTPYETRPRGDVSSRARWEFVGRVAPTEIRKRYRDRDVSRYFKRGLRSPYLYIRC